MWPFGVRHFVYPFVVLGVVSLLVLLSRTGTADAQPLQILIERLDRLERENRQLRKEIDELMAARSATTKPADMSRESKGSGYVRLNSAYGYAVLDPTADINRKQRLILDRKRQGPATDRPAGPRA